MKKEKIDLGNLESEYNRILKEEEKIQKERLNVEKKINAIKKDLEAKAPKQILKIACFSKATPDGPALYFHFLAKVDLNTKKGLEFVQTDDDEIITEQFKEDFDDLIKESKGQITECDLDDSNIRDILVEGSRDNSVSVIFCIENISKEEFYDSKNWSRPIYRESCDSEGHYSSDVQWK